jgi:seryl-tRNA synthetase
MKQERDELYKKAIAQLKKDSTNMKEKIKLLEKRLDFTQDENTKLAVEMQAVLQGVNHILSVGIKLAERERVNVDMGLKPTEGEGPPVKEPKEGMYN